MNATERSTLYFDPDQNAVVDRADGSILPLDVLGSAVQSLPEHVRAQIQCKQDEDYARSLSDGGPKLLGQDDGYAPLDIESRPPQSTRSGGYLSPSHQASGEKSLEQEIIEMHTLYPGGESPPECAAEERPRDADWTLARALQSLEFEIVQDTYHDPLAEDFNEKEYRASSCRRQLMTFSTFVCVVQIGLLVAMVQDDGYAPKDENPLYGPPATTMVRYGAKQAALIKYRSEWWRLISAVMLHAGVMHIITNVFIQLRVGGYLELVFGKIEWFIIYFASGIFGNICSCIFLPDSVGVGSSGAVLGMLCSWLVWIIFRWKKIPRECKPQRNCQLLMVTAAVAVTLAFSFAEYVDWAAHFGGSIQGFLLGAAFLSKELDSDVSRLTARALGFGGSMFLFIYGIVYIQTVLAPPKDHFELFEENDDWGS